MFIDGDSIIECASGLGLILKLEDIFQGINERSPLLVAVSVGA